MNPDHTAVNQELTDFIKAICFINVDLKNERIKVETGR